MSSIGMHPAARRSTLSWLGICPLLGGADSFTHGLALGLASIAVVAATAFAATSLHNRIPDSARTTGLLLAAVTAAIIMRLACEAIDFELALASGGLFALAALHGDLEAGPACGVLASLRHTALPGGLILAGTGALRGALAPEAELPAFGFFLMAACILAWQAWRGRSS